ncbi:Elicitor-responsive protein 1 [Cardamine amara subsp. amara]|uniref:Elicitor-responsive protein 1 n=1 Tax=Cardamine amara subsp. amara TaxID=228776 RepID=A0ABD1BA30_CARAN
MSMMAGIQGQVLEVTVVGCQKLKDTEWFSRQDPYVVLEYSGTRHRTRTCTDGGKNAVFQEKFMFTLLEGLREVKVSVWNSNTLSTDDFIGNGTIQLQKALSQGYDDCTWTLQTKTGRFAGEVRLIIHYAGAKKHDHCSMPSPPPFAPQVPHYSAPPSASPYSPAPYSRPSLYPQLQQYPPPQQSGYPPASAYPPPPAGYPHPPSTPAYPPVPSAYPPPPPSSTYPPPAYPPQPSPYFPQGQYPPHPY